MIARAAAVCVLVSLTVIACSTIDIPAPTKITGMRWRVEAIDGRPETRGILQMESTGDVAIWGACNSWSGYAAITGHAFHFTMGPITTEACTPEERMQYDGRFMTALERAVRWRLEGPRLYFSDKDGRDVLVLHPEQRTH